MSRLLCLTFYTGGYAMTFVAILMGSDSDLPVMESAISVLKDLDIECEVRVTSAHRTPEKVEEFAKNASSNGIKVIIAGAGMAAHLPGVIAAMTPIPVIGVPIKASLDGLDSLLAIVQMPPGIPVATVAINGALNAGILATQMLAVNDEKMMHKTITYKENLKIKIAKANEELQKETFKYRTN